MTDSGLPLPANDYAILLAALKERIRSARLRAVVAVNQELILLYWRIGQEILGRISAGFCQHSCQGSGQGDSAWL